MTCFLYNSSLNSARQFRGTQVARKLLSREGVPPIDVMVEVGIVPRCIEFLRNSNYPDLQFEAAWVLSDIASGNSAQTDIVVKANGVDALIPLLGFSHAHVIEQAIRALANIAGDGPSLRDLVISKGIVDPLVALVNTQSEVREIN